MHKKYFVSSICGGYCDGTETTYNSVPILKKEINFHEINSNP